MKKTEQHKLRKAKLDDARFVLLLNNEKVAREVNIINQNRIPLKDHLKWFPQHLNEFQIIQRNNKDIGFLRNKEGTISICLLPDYRNKGIGTKILSKIKGNALIRIETKQSLNCFLKAGFKLTAFYLEKK